MEHSYISSWQELMHDQEFMKLVSAFESKQVFISIRHEATKDAEGGYGWHYAMCVQGIIVCEKCTKCGYLSYYSELGKKSISEEVWLKNIHYPYKSHRHSWKNYEDLLFRIEGWDLNDIKQAMKECYSEWFGETKS